ncbi:MAG TPA: S41 family peptidase [Verrucomicrobiae bacterium]|nr:S41 family peptidase [Verrucomicrobiae bacterium]
MTKVARLLIVGLALAGLLWPEYARAGSNTNELREATEVIDALKAHYVDREKLDPKLLNDATVSGVLQALGAGAQLLTPEALASNATAVAQGIATNTTVALPSEPLARAEIITPSIGYIRIADVATDTVPALDAELRKFAAEKVDGYVLDLRFADGTNLTAAAAVASRFLAPGQEVFELKQSEGGEKKFRTTEAQQSLAAELSEVPLLLLVNAQTRGSAEVLVGALRAQDRGIVVGAKTAGSAAARQDIKLSDGRILRVATAKVTLPNGGDIFPDGIVPDVPVKIDPKVEADVLLNAPTNLTLSASLQPREMKKSLSEAELVKVYRGEPIGTNVTSTTGNDEEGEVQKVRDVVLQRAVDILKGIRVLLTWQ